MLAMAFAADQLGDYITCAGRYFSSCQRLPASLPRSRRARFQRASRHSLPLYRLAQQAQQGACIARLAVISASPPCLELLS